MTTIRTLIAASILGSLPFGVVFAQTGQTGTAASPLSTEKAPNTTVVGQTKPPKPRCEPHIGKVDRAHNAAPSCRRCHRHIGMLWMR